MNNGFCVLCLKNVIARDAPTAPPNNARQMSVDSGTLHKPFSAHILSFQYTIYAVMFINKMYNVSIMILPEDVFGFSF